MKKIILVTIVCILTLSQVQAQDYKTGIGLRGGFSSGLTVKHFIGEKAALEAILYTRWKGVGITGLYEIHSPAFNTNNLNWFYGLGGHLGSYKGNNVPWAKDEKSYFVVGVDGILGLEYSFQEIPFNLSVDWKPAFDLLGNSGFQGDGGAVSLRYIF